MITAGFGCVDVHACVRACVCVCVSTTLVAEKNKKPPAITYPTHSLEGEKRKERKKKERQR